jgi:hypothetical protein
LCSGKAPSDLVAISHPVPGFIRNVRNESVEIFEPIDVTDATRSVIGLGSGWQELECPRSVPPNVSKEVHGATRGRVMSGGQSCEHHWIIAQETLQKGTSNPIPVSRSWNQGHRNRKGRRVGGNVIVVSKVD